jgi:modification target Cys-rich repeat protein
MAITNLSVARINNIKARMKTVFAKRKYYGSLESLASSANDFSTIPALNGLVLSEHGAKTINLMLSVNSMGNLKKIEADNYILRDISAIETWLNNYENASSTATVSGCSGKCSGICVSHCSENCGQNCLGSCTGSCYNSCSSGCLSSCTGGCVGTCNSSCSKDCSSSCTGGAKA